MKRRILALLLTICMMFALASCGDEAFSKEEFLEYYLQLDNSDAVSRFSTLKRNLDAQIERYRENGDNIVSKYKIIWRKESRMWVVPS